MRAFHRVTIALAFAFTAAACGASGNDNSDARPADGAGGTPDAAPGSTDAGCFTHPTSHYEIINACTSAQFVDKNPTLPLALPDGGMPPLPP